MAVALGAGFVSQFLGPAAVRSAVASFSSVRSGRQDRGASAWSARSGLLSFWFTKVSNTGGTLHTLPFPPTMMPNRSSRAPTACHAGHQALGLRPILRLLSSAPRRRCRLNSNVRQHTGYAVAASARSAAQSAVSLNSHDAAEPRNPVSTVPRLNQWLSSELPECQRWSPPLALHLYRAPAAEDAGSFDARRRKPQSKGRRQSVRRPAANGLTTASFSRVSRKEQ